MNTKKEPEPQAGAAAVHPAPKKPYRSPTLTVYGTIQDLTTAGSALVTEMTGSTNLSKKL